MVGAVIAIACGACGSVLLALGIIDIGDRMAARLRRRRVERVVKAAVRGLDGR